MPSRSVRSTAVALSAAYGAGAVALAAVGPSMRQGGPHWAMIGGFTVAFAVVSALPMRLDLSEHRLSFTLAEAVLVAGLFSLGTPWLALAAAAGELLENLAGRTPAIKTAWNSAGRAGTTAVAAASFTLLAPAGRGPGSWLAALAAVATSCLFDTAAVAAILSCAEGSPYSRMLSRSLPTALVTSGLAGSVGLLVVELHDVHRLAPLTLAPLAVGVWCNNRATARQRDEHLRTERLYEATGRTSRLAAGLPPLEVVADEARRLLTGSVALCAVRRSAGDGGDWQAVAVGSGGAVEVPIGALDAVLGTPAGVTGAVPTALRPLAPEATTLVATRSPVGAGVELVLAVLRTDDAGADLCEVLAAYAAHGAVIVANARVVEELRAALGAQVEANRRKDEFVATISHELRTPLTVMLGTAQTLESAGERLGGEDRQRLLRVAVNQGRRLHSLIEDLLLVAAAEHGKMTCTPVALSVDEVVADLTEDIPADLLARVRVVNAAPGDGLVADPNRLRQVVTNLVGNAGKYAPDGPIDLTIAARPAAGVVAVSVADHGPGIPAADRDRVFERFVQLDQSHTRAQGGTGLGLFVCRQLAERLGGELDLHETPGGGCTFELRLPRVAAPAPAGEAITGPSVGDGAADEEQDAFDDDDDDDLPGFLRRPVTI